MQQIFQWTKQTGPKSQKMSMTKYMHTNTGKRCSPKNGYNMSESDFAWGDDCICLWILGVDCRFCISQEKCPTSSASDYALLQIQQGLLHKALAQLPNLKHQEFSGQWPNKRWLWLSLWSSWLHSTMTVSFTFCRR